MNQNPIESFTTAEMATILKMSPAAIRRLCAAGRIPARKAGRAWRCSRAAFERWLEGSNAR